MKQLLILVMLFVVQILTAQDFQGVVTYQTNRKLDIKLDSTQLNSDMQKQIFDMMKKQFQKEYTLRFNKTASIYKLEESLDKPEPTSGIKVNVVIHGSGASDVLYKDIQEKKYAASRDIFGKVFLVKDSLSNYDWKLENETKKIGEYTCYKATFKSKMNIVKSSNTTSSIQNQENQDNIDNEVSSKDAVITAWYTPEIPVSNGPSVYWGLPGLILEVNDGMQNILCSKIVLNSKKKIEITPPTKGKEVTEEKYNSILKKKTKENNIHTSKRVNGSTMKFKIGG